MLISCPKCNALYDIAENLLPESGKKMRCARCGNIWQAKPGNALPEPEATEPAAAPAPEIPAFFAQPEPEPEQKADQDPNAIFTRLADQTQIIFGADKDGVPLKASDLKENLGLNKKSHRLLYLAIFLVLGLLSLFYARYEITKTMPFMGPVYKSLGIKATIPGYGLEFQNVVRNEFTDSGLNRMEIKGFVANISQHMVDVPAISVQMLDKDAKVLQTVETKVPVAALAPDGKIAFTAVVVKPSPLTAYILLTFTEE